MTKNKPYVIMTSSDAKYGDFLINHWLRSLQDNIDKDYVDIAVLNYGLKDEQKKSLISKGVKVVNCACDGHVVNIRYRDMLNFLNKNKYEEVMSCDGGDIIFQDNIMDLFKLKKTEIKVVVEKLLISTNEFTLFSNAFSNELKRDILNTIKNKKVINGGMIIAPADKFKKICLKMNLYIKNKNGWGPDQVILNYLLYNWGFYELDEKYNFIICTTKSKFKIINGVFVDKDNKPIPIVHNTGGKDSGRPIKNFGYGPNNNQIRMYYYFLRFIFVFGFIAAFSLRYIIKLKLKWQKINPM